jgi:hypothetical protein
VALQSSGQISMSQINTELGRSSTAEISLDAAENGSYAAINQSSASRPSSGNPASMSEWYGYNHSAVSCPAYGTYQYAYCSGCDQYAVYADGACGTYQTFLGYNPSACGCCDIYGTYLGSFCVGCSVYYSYANGNCGSYSEFAYSDCGECYT